MATITAAQAGAWTTAATWTGGVAPVAGDTADLNGFVVSMDVAALPVGGGTLLALVSPAKVGQLTVALDVLGNCSIAATTITKGTVLASFILATGAAPTKTLTVTGLCDAGSITGYYSIGNNSTGAIAVVGGPSATGHNTVANLSTGTVNITGNVPGGSLTSAIGALNNSTGTMNLLTSNLTGGAGYNAQAAKNAAAGALNVGQVGTASAITGSATASSLGYGLLNVAAGVVTLTNVNVIDGAGCNAYAGKSAVYVNTIANYYQTAAGQKYPFQLAAGQVLKGVNHGGTTGTLEGCIDTNSVVNAGGIIDNAGAWYAEGAFAGGLYSGLDSVLASASGNWDDGGLDVTKGLVGMNWGVGGAYAGVYVAPVAAGYSALAPGFGADGGTAGTLAAAKIFDGTYGTLAEGSILVAAGGSYVVVAAADVESGVTFGASSAQTGTFAKPAVGKVISDTSYGAAGTEFTGTYHPTLVTEVLDTVSFGALSAETGTYHAPAASEVWHTAVFGPASGTAGTKVASSIANCAAGNIKTTIVIDDVTGTLDVLSDNPAASDVKRGVAVGVSVGTWPITEGE